VPAVIEQIVNGAERVRLAKDIVEAPLADGGRLSLVRKWPVDGPVRGAVVLLHGFAQNRYTWHLDTRSIAAYLVSRGYDVFNLELRGHGRSRALGSPLPETFEEHVDADIPAAVAALERLGHQRLFLIGHSLGGAVAYAAAPRLGDRVRGVITLAGVFRWGQGARVLAALTSVLHWADRLHRFVHARTGPTLRLDLVGRFLAKNIDAFESGRRVLPIAGWSKDSIERAILREWLAKAFDRTSGSVLALMGRWAQTGAFCDTAGTNNYAEAWASSRTPALVIAGDDDQLADAENDVRPAYQASTSVDRTYRLFGRARDGVSFGHVDLIIGRQAPRLVWPEIAEWLDAR
jgi:polyhydroxyalkanoate synthase subunit PhaC